MNGKQFVLIAMCVTVVGAGCSGGENNPHDDHDHDHKNHDGGMSSDVSFAEFTEKRETATENEDFYVEYTPEPDPIPLNELFTMTVKIGQSSDMNDMVSGADVTMDAHMPTHGHGMNTEPSISEQSDGTYLVEGMKFHMPSDSENPWVMDVTVEKDGTSDVAKFMVTTKEE